ERIAALAADEFEWLGEPRVLVLVIDIGAAAERNRDSQRSGKTDLVSPKLHHRPPAAPTLAECAGLCCQRGSGRILARWRDFGESACESSTAACLRPKTAVKPRPYKRALGPERPL